MPVFKASFRSSDFLNLTRTQKGQLFSAEAPFLLLARLWNILNEKAISSSLQASTIECFGVGQFSNAGTGIIKRAEKKNAKCFKI